MMYRVTLSRLGLDNAVKIRKSTTKINLTRQIKHCISSYNSPLDYDFLFIDVFVYIFNLICGLLI